MFLRNLRATASGAAGLQRSVLQAASKKFAPHASSSSQMIGRVRHTTIVCVRKNGSVCMAGDGQVSLGSSVVKGNARKIRRLEKNILVGFAGSTADALTLLERLEQKLEAHPAQLMRACVELAKAWRTDKYLRRLEAVLLVADDKYTFELTGNGDVLEPQNGVMGVGSGGTYAQAAALALMDQPNLSAEDIARKAMKIAGDICVYTNDNVIFEVIEKKDDDEKGKSSVSEGEEAAEGKKKD
jgi:ATP-dependent HslUV protease, peptidase subunit HslV